MNAFRWRAPFVAVLLVIAPLAQAMTPNVYFVSVSATGAGDGSSWANAFTSVQPAIDAAAAGDQVWVAKGRYVGTITVPDGVALYGGLAGTEDAWSFPLDQRNISSNATILDGAGGGSVVTVVSGATRATRVDGFTITGGTGRLMDAGYWVGGGVHLTQCSPTIVHNRVMANRLAAGDASYGGGVYVDGGAPLIADNVIIANSAYHGAGIHVWAGTPIIVSNSIVANDLSALNVGAGATVANNLIAHNGLGVVRETSVIYRNNCVYGNIGGNYGWWDTDPTGVDGNISVDPRLEDHPFGRVHLQANSPCIGAGDNAYVATFQDMDGQSRILPPGGTVDIGADESDGSVWAPEPRRVVRVAPGGDDFNDGSSWMKAKRTVQAGINAASAVGGEIWVKSGTYVENIHLHAFAHLYGGFTGEETALADRDWTANVTTLRAAQQGSVVTGGPGCRVSVFDGFTVTGGAGTVVDGYLSGGGLLLLNSGPIVRNNRIAGNGGLDGSGIFVKCATPLISRNSVEDNEGCGISLYNSLGEVLDNTAAGNAFRGITAAQGTVHYGAMILRGNRVEKNTAPFCAGVYLLGPVHLENSLIEGNRATSGAGGGVCVQFGGSGDPVIVNSTIVANFAAYAGAAYFAGHCFVKNTIFAFNSSPYYPAPSWMEGSCIFNSSLPVTPSGPDGSIPNIYEDPQFVLPPDPGPDGVWATADDIQGDLHLLASSPCVEAGSNSGVIMGTDLDGRPRIADGDGDGAAVVDMGAYELPALSARADLDADGDVDPADYAFLAECLAGPDRENPGCPDDQFAGADLDDDGDVDLADFAMFTRVWSTS